MTLLFSCLDPIEDSQLPRVGIVYGTSELHGAYDYHSFTEMLERLVRENNLSLQFTQISRLHIYRLVLVSIPCIIMKFDFILRSTDLMT